MSNTQGWSYTTDKKIAQAAIGGGKSTKKTNTRCIWQSTDRQGYWYSRVAGNNPNLASPQKVG